MLKTIGIWCVVLLLCGGMAAQSTSLEFEGGYAAKLKARLNAVAGATGAKGLSAAVLVPGQGIWVGTWGLAYPATPVTPDMRFGVASNSKAIVAALLLKLQEEGALSLDDPLSDYLPTKPTYSGAITIRQLLTHTTGLFDFLNDWTFATQNAYGSDADSLWSFTDLVATLSFPVAAPGTAFSYSNTNYLLAGMVAEAATGVPIAELLRTRIFEPLDVAMAYPPDDDIFADPYSNLWDGNSTVLTPGGSRTFLSFTATAGSIWSTPYDMVRWYDALFGDEWLTEASQQELRDHDGYSAYALGVRMRNTQGRSIYYHAGSWGYRSYMIYDPASGITVCLLANSYGSSVGTAALSLLDEALDEKPRKTYDAVVLKVQPVGTTCVWQTQRTLVRNEGEETITQLHVTGGIDGVWLDSTDVLLGPPLLPGLQTYVETELALPVADEQTHELQMSVEQAQPDGYPRDNKAVAEVRYEDGVGQSLPFVEDFEMAEAFPASLISLQSDNLLDWRVSAFVAHSGQQSLARNNYDDGNTGVKYRFELPLLQLGTAPAELRFAYAYTTYSGQIPEEMQVLVSTDCGATFVPLLTLTGTEWMTATPTSSAFRPDDEEWAMATVDLSAYANENILLRFEMANDYGNLVYIDDIVVDFNTAVEEVPSTEVRISPNPASQQVQVDWQTARLVGAAMLVDSYGRTVRNYLLQPGQQSLTIERSGLPDWVYFLRLPDGKGVYRIGFVR